MRGITPVAGMYCGLISTSSARPAPLAVPAAPSAAGAGAVAGETNAVWFHTPLAHAPGAGLACAAVLLVGDSALAPAPAPPSPSPSSANSVRI